MSDDYMVKNKGFKILHSQAKQLVAKFDFISFTHIPRDRNSDADALVNQAIDAHA
jgi:hypothetical protein